MGDTAGRFDRLKARQRAERDQYPEALGLRVHRALSWLKRAEDEADADSRFIFLWIAFNAAYATEFDRDYSLNAQDTFSEFLRKLSHLDTHNRLNELVWQAYPGAIRVLLDNRYVFSPFWDYQRGNRSEQQWQASFERAKKAAHTALSKQDTPTVLAIVLDRVYTLRNQLIHGGATWNGRVNRDQMRDCVAIMGELAPLVIEIMMDHPDALWGDAAYPVVD